MDGNGNASELYGVYSSKADADKAVANIKAWAAQIQKDDAAIGVAQSDWDITKIEVDRQGGKNSAGTTKSPTTTVKSPATGGKSPSATVKSPAAPAWSFGTKMLFQQDLDTSRAMLKAKKAELTRWDAQAKANFKANFGTTDIKARNLILDRINRALALSNRLTPDNFVRADTYKPDRLAYVDPKDPTRIYIDRAYIQADPTNTDARAGTILHEISHFFGTKDWAVPYRVPAYGVDMAQMLANNNSALALQNADNFTFYVEGAIKPRATP
jgi:Lysine-specific metallo-endopeptidase